MNHTYSDTLHEALAVFGNLSELEEGVELAAQQMIRTINSGGKILVCGNGGSACEAQHLAGELVGRYKKDRRALPAIALNADGSTLSCIGNDYSFDQVFSRQLEALGRTGDLLIVFTSSGESRNICEVLRVARQLDIASIGFLGKGGGAALPLCDHSVVVASSSTARVQEAHQFLLHHLMDRVEAGLGLS
jgi:D-sedoheptulose 7-phosphate isomerase